MIFSFLSYIKFNLFVFLNIYVGAVPFAFALEIKSWYVLNFIFMVFLAWTCGNTYGNLSLKYLSAAVGCLILMVIVYCERSKVMRQKVSSRAYRASCWGTYTRKKLISRKWRIFVIWSLEKKRFVIIPSIDFRLEPARPGPAPTLFEGFYLNKYQT